MSNSAAPRLGPLDLDAPRLCLTLLCLLFFAVPFLHLTDPDYWWHLRTGRLIAETRSVPQTDPFSFTAAGKPWVAHEWLAALVIYAVQSAGGYVANVALFSAMALAALLVAYRQAVSFGLDRWLAVGLLGWAAMISTNYWVVRPQVFSWPLFALYVALILDHERERERKRLWLLPVLMVPWANLHGGYVFGLGVLGVYILALAAGRFFGAQTADPKPALYALAGCVAATLITPNPGELLLYPLTYLRPGNASLQFIAEWQSPNFHKASFLPLCLAILLLVGLGVLARARELFLPLLALALTYLALQSNRNHPLFAIVFLIVVAATVTERWPWTKVPPGPRPSPTERLLNAGLLVAAVAAAAAFLWNQPTAQLRREANVSVAVKYPRAGAEFIRSHYPTARLFNEYLWGGYLINELYPQRVFIDGRADVYGDAFVQDYRRITNLEGNWQAILDRYRIEVMIISTDSPLAAFLDGTPGGWQRVFTGPIEAVFARRGSAP